VATAALTEKLAKLGLRSTADLVLHLPLRYEDETTLIPIAQLRPGQTGQVEGVVSRNEILYKPRRQMVVALRDESGELLLRFLNFYGSQVKQMAEGRRLRVRGEVRGGFFGTEMVHPRCRPVEEGAPLPSALTPVYPTTEGVSQTQIRNLIGNALQEEALADTVPEPVRSRYRLVGFADAVRLLHGPPPDVSAHQLDQRVHPAWLRIKFDELLAQQLSLKRARAGRLRRAAHPMPARGELTQRLAAALPFSLTGAQARVWHEVSQDMARRHPMQRLVQGDVGSGKTVIAALACAQAIENGFQAALMAPTEILAEQHFRKLVGWLEPLGLDVAWLTGSLKAKDKRAGVERIESGQAALVVGTQALIQEGVCFARLGLAVVDEQHRFGVGQRLALRSKASGFEPHQLMMSATPIPRTLAMTYFADLEVSVIDELPPGRSPVLTKLVSDARREEVIGRVADAAGAGQQVYWVCPLIEPGEENPDAPPSARGRRASVKADVQNAVQTFETLSQALPGLKVGLVHGRLTPTEKAGVMAAFVAGEVDVLVSTTVIEVGVDVPNASLMVIEHAERFGLSQLHQLRGRVGRGRAQSACILMYQEPLSAAAKERLRIMHASNDGFEIARKDLELRGPGEFLGNRQSGLALLRFTDLERDQAIVEWAREAAAQLLEHEPESVDAHLRRWMSGREDFLKT
jgi:ATP-dependent DNA helicase RecG